VKVIILVFLFGLFPVGVFAATPVLNVIPEHPIQGQAVMIRLEGATSTAVVSSLKFDTHRITPIAFDSAVIGLYGIDIGFKPGDYTVSLKLTDGTDLEKVVTVLKRVKDEAPLGIPAKLGGNTAMSQKALVDTLAVENAQLASLVSGKKVFWSKSFRYPVHNPVVTDPYGYSRITGSYTITHKGTDFRASSTTKVLASNRGVVRLVKTFRDYGKTVIVDHGLGVMTFYMHLSKITVNAGELILPGQLIGYAGQTGYAEKPHLHFTVRVNGSSVDPIEFLKLFGVN